MASAITDNGRLPRLSTIQAKLLHDLKLIELEIGSRFLLADPYSTEITFWFLGDRKRLLEVLARSDYQAIFRFDNDRRPERRQGERIGWFGDTETQAFASVTVYDRIYLGKWLAYNSMSGARILFPSVDPITGNYKVSEYCFTQMELGADERARFPAVRVLGEEFEALPNLGPVMNANTIPEVVDLVYTWVDGSDPEWLRQKQSTLGAAQSNPYTPDGDIASRYVSRDELRYSLRSAWMYFRNIGKIYIVTSGQRPSFLKADSDIVKFIDHRDIFPNEADLPTFNSHAIESNLHRIPGLSEKYLYLNDDVLFCRPITSKLFFDEYGRSLYFPSRSIAIPSGPATVADPAGDAAAKNARDLLEARFGVYVTRKFKHTPIALIKSVVEQMEQEWPKLFRDVSATRIRSYRDYAISGSLYFHYATCIGKATAGDIVYNYFDINGDDFIEAVTQNVYAEVDTKRLDTMCINDRDVTDKTGINENFFRHLMEEIFPEPAPFEVGQ